MTSWAFLQEELSREDIPYILEVEKAIVSFHETKEASIANKTIKSFQYKAFKLLIEHNNHLLKKDGDKNHQIIHSCQGKLEKMSSFLGDNLSSISFISISQFLS